MKFLVAALIALLATPLAANEDPALEDLLWVARPLLIFADSELDPAVADQMQFLEQWSDDLEERDVVVFVDTDPAARSELRQALRPVGFNVVLIDKEGNVLLRRPTPQTAREIIGQIDRTSLRRQEIQARRERDQ